MHEEIDDNINNKGDFSSIRPEEEKTGSVIKSMKELKGLSTREVKYFGYDKLQSMKEHPVRILAAAVGVGFVLGLYVRRR
jgi:ElaB/YqjD/DUF883 family membrane-anchored ribosome-binding protein